MSRAFVNEDAGGPERLYERLEQLAERFLR